MYTYIYSVDEEKLWVDLRAYSNPSVYYVTEDSSVTKVCMYVCMYVCM